jgi:cobyrinic acid a,c-diamide synthase
MTPEICREVLQHGSRGADVAVVEGHFGDTAGGSLDVLGDWLELPRWMIVDGSAADPCRVPQRPTRVDGIWLTNVDSPGQLAYQRYRWETLWGVRVLGALSDAGHLQAIVGRLPAGARPSRELCRALADKLTLFEDVDQLLAGISRPTFETAAELFAPQQRMAGLNVAVAFDEAFDCYFPDTLDLLELGGATLSDFSPLADEELPPETNIVYLGCGNPQRVAQQLAANHCMISTLRRYARQGGRIYAEGGGLAYLCQQLEFPDGRRVPMTGLIPAIARYEERPKCPSPAEVTLASDCWLGRAGRQLRGYRNSRWRIEPTGPVETLAVQPGSRFDLLRQREVIGSRIHLSLVAQPHLVESFSSTPVAAVKR